MKITKIRQRYYLTDDTGDRLKLIPQQYKEVALTIKYDNYYRLRLSHKERLRLEVALFVKNLRKNNVLVWEQIDNKEFEGANLMKVRYGEDKYCAVFNGVKVICPELIYRLALKTLYFTDISHVNG